MKVLVALLGFLACAYAAGETCYKDVNMDCSQASSSLGGAMKEDESLPRCNAIYGDYGRHGNVAGELQAYANLHLERSYQYLLTSAYFNNYQTNRAGFGKLFRKLSDEAWGKTIDLIKHITLRGDVMDFARRSPHDAQDRNFTVELHELESLAKALDTQKEIAERAFHIHKEATRNNEKLHDPEITQYLEEEFIEGHAKTIRNLAGHTTDLKKFITANNGQDLSLALYLFDEYLQKVV